MRQQVIFGGTVLCAVPEMGDYGGIAVKPHSQRMRSIRTPKITRYNLMLELENN